MELDIIGFYLILAFCYLAYSSVTKRLFSDMGWFEKIIVVVLTPVLMIRKAFRPSVTSEIKSKK